MSRLTILLLLATLLLLVSSNRGKNRGRGKDKRPKKPVSMCRYLDDCRYPFFPWCLQDFSVADAGRTILYSRPVTGLLTSGTKKRDRLGSLVLFSDEGEVMELTLEITLASSKDSAARVFVAVFRAMCPDFLAEITLCDPMFTHDEAYPIFDSCDAVLKVSDHHSTYNTLRLETDGVYLQLFFNEQDVGKLTLPHVDCDISAPRVEINKVAFTNKPRSMPRSPMCCN